MGNVSISIHAPARGATSRVKAISGATGISIHAPARGATWMQIQWISLMQFQSTLPRGERREAFELMGTGFQISIHAPARGATLHQIDRSHNPAISIHAPARGATFQRLCKFTTIIISIHAPARGATDFSWL